MSQTVTTTDTTAAAPVSEAGPPPGTVAEAPPAGLAGWFSTDDHKRVGRLYLGTSLLFLLVGGVLGQILGVERIDSGLQVLTDDTFGQVYTLHGEVSVLLFLVPFILGLATYLVPLQVGSPDIAFPRGSATAYWGYVIGGFTLLAAYVANGGPGGGSDVGGDLYLLSLVLLTVTYCLALVSILTTILTLRAPGMTLARTPLFTWSLLVGGGLTLLASPVLLAQLIELFIHHHFTGDFGGVEAYERIDWFWSVPQVHLLAVPAAGIAAEIVPVMVRGRFRRHLSVVAVIVVLGVLGFGAWSPPAANSADFLYVVVGLAAVLPALALVGLLGDTVRRGTLTRQAPLLLALGAVVHLLLGALAGAMQVISGLELRGTAWEAAQVHYSLYGAATLAAFAALWYWAPKIWGVHLSNGAGTAAFALTFWGALLLAAPDLLTGLVYDQRLQAGQFDDNGVVALLNGASAVGGALAVLGALVVVAELLVRAGRRSGAGAAADPWGGHTLEWATASPPPPGNFAEPVAPVASAAPLAGDDAAGADREEVTR